MLSFLAVMGGFLGSIRCIELIDMGSGKLIQRYELFGNIFFESIEQTAFSKLIDASNIKLPFGDDYVVVSHENLFFGDANVQSHGQDVYMYSNLFAQGIEPFSDARRRKLIYFFLQEVEIHEDWGRAYSDSIEYLGQLPPVTVEETKRN